METIAIVAQAGSDNGRAAIDMSVSAKPVATLFPTIGQQGDLLTQVISVQGPIGDYRSALKAPEQDAVASAVAKRQREFAAGRAFARIAMHALELPELAIPQGPQRAPQWPAQMLGSISHSDLLAWVVAAPLNALAGLGADLERTERLQPDLYDKLFTATECALIAEFKKTEPTLATALFSAKEAVYKATNPIAGAFIGFQEVEVLLDAGRTQFRMRYLGDHQPSAVMERGRGYLQIQPEHVLALFVIPQTEER